MVGQGAEGRRMDEGWWWLMEKEGDTDLLLVSNYRRYLYSSNYSTTH